MSKTSIQYIRAKRYPLRPATNGTLYGVNVFEPPYLASHANVITTAQAMGVQVIRCGITWSNMQTTVGGSIAWSEFDSIYAKCVAAGITIIFVIETTPTAYNTTPHGFFASAPSVLAIPTVTDPTYFPLWVSDQATWAGQVAARYPLALLEWWNEWATASGYWKENDSAVAKPTISAWVTAYTAAYTAIKAANPSSTVAVGGLTDLTHWFGANATVGVEAMRQLFQTYSLPMDAMSIHPYTGDTSDPNPALDHYGKFGATGFANSFGDIARCQQIMVACGYGSTPLWVTEWGNYSAAAVGGASVKAGYVTYTLNKINKLYGYGAVGPNGAPVTIATFYPMIDTSFAPTDVGLVGPNGNGPYTLNSSGTAFQTFMASLPTVTRTLSRLYISGDASVINTHSTTAYTVVGLDQFGAPISIFPIGQTPTFASSNAAKATIDPSTGIATGVSAGTTTITASVGALTTTNSVTLTVGAQVATASVVSPNPWSRTAGGSTVAFSVVVTDQGTPANPIASPAGAWSSSDNTNAAIDSSTGIMTPTGVSAGVVITFTPTGVPGAAGTSTGDIAAGGAPFLNSITISGPTTGVATHDTSAYTASGFDQYSAPFSFTPVWQTSDASKATINASSGVAHGVAAGTSSITATGAGVTSNAITLTIAAQVATTVTVSPSSFTIGSIGGTQALSAAVADQLGGPISSPTVTWGSSDITKATVDSSGVVTNVAAGSATITATSGSASGTSAATLSSGGGAVGFDTTSYNASTGAGIGGSSGAAPMVRSWDVANRWANDSAWRAQFASKASLGGRSNWIYSDNTKDGTGSYNATPASSAQYDDGIYIDLAQWQNSIQYSSQPAFQYTLVGANQASSAPVAHLATRLTAGTGEGWMWFRRQFQVNWTNVGDADSTNGGAAFNATQNASLKWGGFFAYSTGRAGITTSSGSGHTANINIENNPGNTNGLPESFGGFNVTTEWTSGAWFDYVIRSRQFIGGNGNVWAGLTIWERAIGSAHFARLSARLIGDTGAGTGYSIEEYISTCLNMNQSFKTNQVYYQWGHAAWNRASNSDPFGIETYEAGLTPAVPLTNTLNHQTGGSITCNVQINLYTAALRPVIDGTPVVGQDFTIVSTVSEGGTVTPTVTGVPTGTHTIGWVAVNANNSATSAQSSTISVTV